MPLPAHAPAPTPAAPARVLGPFDATCIVIGAIIGVGIFFNPARVAKLTESGAYALAGWALAGFIALCGGLTFAALGRRYHASGAQYQLLRDAYGPVPAFLFVFCNATAIQAAAIGVIAMVCANNLLALAQIPAPSDTARLGLALALIAVVTLANILGVRWGALLQNLTVSAKVAAILCIVALAAYAWFHALTPPPVPTPAPKPGAQIIRPVPGLGGVVAALVPAFFAYGGWQHALWISGEVRDPRRNLPRSIILGVLVVVAVYLSANWAYLTLLSHAGVAASDSLAADAVGAVFPGWASRAVAAAVSISALGVLNAQLLSGPRLVYGMAADGRFFAPFARLHPRFGTPFAAILLLGIVGAGLLIAAGGAEGVDKLTAGAVFVDGLFFILTSVALLRMPALDGEAPIPGAKPAAVIFILGELGVLVGSFLAPDSAKAALGGLAWVAGAGLMYAVFFRTRRA